jgi:2-hydroxychromene-2-carboxylate isomerase
LSQVVDFFFSPGSRYCYLAASQLPALEGETGCRVEWRPVHGPDLRALRGRDPFAGSPVSGQYEWEYRRRDAESWADLYGIAFHEPQQHEFDFRLLVRAATAASLLGAVTPYAWKLCSAIFGAGIWPLDGSVCVDIARTVGLDVSRFEELLDSKQVEAALHDSAAEAHRRGAFGVPTFFVGEELFWGNDRLPLVRHALRAARIGANRGGSMGEADVAGRS